MAVEGARVFIQLNPKDNVAIARQEINAGEVLSMPGEASLTIRENIPAGHKFALLEIPRGEAVYRYGYPIGITTKAVVPGTWVHTHNLSAGETYKEYQWKIVDNINTRPSTLTFLGYPRSGGRAGTRNYIAVISTVNCSAHVSLQIARTFTPERLVEYPNVDGVIPLVHHSGCSYPPGGLSQVYLQRTLANVARNPNIGGYLWVGLGCEINQVDGYCSHGYTNSSTDISDFLINDTALVIQEQGGFRKTVQAGIEAIDRLLPQVNIIRRQPCPVSQLTIALQCGGSDSWSGLTANPLVGLISDKIVGQGGTTVLAETPEIFGAEHLLTNRVTSREVGEKLIRRFQWWYEQSVIRGFSVDNNPTPGNKAGGLTTIFEKSLGAVAKGGSAPLTAVLEYAEVIDQHGFTFMDTPGNDWTSVTGQLAGGCNLILFTTGRGSVFSSNLAPCIKIATNTRLFQRMSEDMDFNAGKILEGASMQQGSQELLDQVIRVASGERTKSEQNGLPEVEFVPWQPDAVL